MRPTILRSLLGSPAVTPLPIRSPFDQQVSAEIDSLQGASESTYTTATWLLQALDASIATQKIALDSLANVTNCRDSDHKAIDKYLDDHSIEMLDACSNLLEKIEIIRKYLESLRVVSHLLDGQVKPSAMALGRAQDVLESCEAMQRKVLSQKLARGASSSASTNMVASHESELGEILSGSNAVALTACRFLGLALSFKSNRWLPTTVMQSRRPPMSLWLISLQELQKQVKVKCEKHKRSSSSMRTLTELRVTVMAARDLRGQIKSGKLNKLGPAVEEMKRSCGELEEGIDVLEGRVKELCKNLIYVRMALLGILSQA
ncbi:BPS1-like protein [Fagus crenata]